MSGKPKLLYWDTCIFLAWIKMETCWPEDVTKGIEQVVDSWRSGKTIIVTSSLTMLEVLSAQLSVDQKDLLRKVFSQPTLQLVDIDRRISAKASVIRQFYDDRTFHEDGSLKSGRIMGIGDAIHLATALSVDRLSEFQTLDGAGKQRKKFALLDLGETVAEARLNIRLPRYVPPPVLLDAPAAAPGFQSSLAFEDSIPLNDPHDGTREIIAVLREAIRQCRFRDVDEIGKAVSPGAVRG